MSEPAKKKVEKIIQFPTQNTQQAVLSRDDLQEIIQEAVTAAATPKKKKKPRPTDSMYTSDGRKKPAAADPIRSKNDFQVLANYLGTNGNPRYRLRNKTIFVLGCSVGLRCGDILKLKTADVYTPTGQVKKHLELFEQKTRKRNVCKISKMAIDTLKEYRDECEFPIDEDTYLFQSKKGNGKLNVRTYYHILKDASVACGLEEDVGTHTMRKTYAMVALQSAEGTVEAGDTLQMLQMKLNHSDARITMRYCKVAQDKMDEMSDRVSDWFE